MTGDSPFSGDRRRSRSRSPRRSGKGPGYAKGDGTSKMIYISNVPYETRWVELKNILREYGEISFVEILEDKGGRSKGSAIAEFKTREDTLNCIHNMTPRFKINGRPVIVKEISNPNAFFRKVKEETGVDYLSARGPGAREFAEQSNIGNYETYGLSPEFLRTHNIQPPLTDRVFVANIAFNVQPGRLYDVFSLAGRITWLDLSMDKEGKSKGNAVIEFSHPLEAVQAVSMFNHQKLFDRPLAVKIDKCEKAEKRPGELPKGLVSIGMGLGADGAPLKDVTSVLSTIRNDTYGANPAVGLPEPSLPVIAPSMGLSMGSMGGQMGGSMGAMGGSMGSSYGGPQVVPAPSYGGMNAQSYGSSSAFGGGGSASSGAPRSSANYGSSSDRGDTVFSSRIVLIKNLPTDYNWNIVNDRVTTYGEVESTEMVGPGMARIRYVHLSDAEGARKALSGTVVEGRPIQVEYVHEQKQDW